MSQVRSTIASVQATVTSAGRSVSGFLGLAGGIGGFGGLGFVAKMAADAESTEVAFGVLLKSMDKAKELVGELRTFAAETPLEFPEVTAATQQLLAYGFAQQEIIPTMRALGDVASGLNVPIGEMAYLFGTARTQGRLFSRDIHQFTARGVPVIDALAQHMGVAKSAVMGLVEEGKVGFGELVGAFMGMTGPGGQFFDMMDAKSNTLAGQWAKLKDNVALLAIEVGTKLLPAFVVTVSTIGMLVDGLRNMDATTVKNVAQMAAFVGGLAAGLFIIPRIIGAIRLIISAFRAMATAQSITMALGGPAGWAALAAGLLLAAGAATTVGEIFGEVEKRASDLAKKASSAGDATNQLKEMMDQAKASAAGVNPELEKMVEAGKRITEEMRTPVEIFRDRMVELNGLVRAGALTWDTYGRAAEAARKTLDDALQTKKEFDSPVGGVGAVTRGSTAGFSAAQEGTREMRRLASQQAETQKRQLAEEKRAADILARIEPNLQPITVQPVNI